jgi:hypothetical protein
VDDAPSGQRFGKLADLVHHSARGERGVVRDGLMTDVYKLEQWGLPGAIRTIPREIG